ncbi:4'-phosphopantetheinyl transferase superfamily protein [Streptomyces sp. NPDC093225]|uniref:4'-phosphopantetheinyl transferase superfamily protein n=1 Tax=Streptomyces sp. NPDC093225 TaxID=3366034 RepID=UPI003823AC1E
MTVKSVAGRRPAPVRDWVPVQTLPRHLHRVRPRLRGVGFGIASVHEGPPPAVHEAELALAAQMPPARRADFLIGRCALRRALRDAGIAAGPVLREGPRPRFPAGVTGSVSHSRGVAVAVVARTAEVPGLGVDLEFGGPPPAAAHLVLGPAERDLVRSAAAQRRMLELYAAKEAAFKALSPLLGAELPGLRAVRLRPRADGFAAGPAAGPGPEALVTCRPVPGGMLAWAVLDGRPGPDGLDGLDGLDGPARPDQVG